MPPRMMSCEFCAHEARKDAMGEHVRAKHVEDIGSHLLDEYMRGEMITPIRQYAEGKSLKIIPIQSIKHQGVYWFGVKAKYFDDDDSWASYIADTTNMEAHEEFLLKVFDTITLRKYIQTGRELHVKSVEMMKTLSRVREVEYELKERNQELEDYKRKVQYMVHRVEELQNCIDENEPSTIIQQECSKYKLMYEQSQRELKNMNVLMAGVEQKHQQHIQNIYDEQRSIRREQEEQLTDLMEKLRVKKVKQEKEDEKEMSKAEREKAREKAKAKAKKKKLLMELLTSKSDSDDDE